MALPDAFNDPVTLGFLTVVIILAVHYQRGLSWREYRTIHRLKQLTFPILQRIQGREFTIRGRTFRLPEFASFINTKSGRNDAEYLVTLNGGLRDVTRTLLDGGGSLHLISSVKRRWTDGDLSDAHVVWFHDGGDQTEAYLFDGDGSVDVYVHFEASVTDPKGHLTDGQQDGDPQGVVRAALEDA